jgi:hypothetical protein
MRASSARSVSSRGISSRKRERIPYCVAPNTARRRALVMYRERIARVTPT